MFRVAKYYRSPNYTNYSCLIIAVEGVNDYLRKVRRIDKARTKSVTQWEGGQHLLKDHPTQQTSPEVEYKAK